MSWQSPGPEPVFLPPVPDDEAADAPGGRRVASFGHRAGAALIDFGILFVVLVVVILATVDPATLENDGELSDGATLTLGVTFLGASLLYPWLTTGLMGGRTIGKAAIGIRVVREDDGRPVGLGIAALRELLVKGALAFFTIPILVSYLWPLGRDDRRALHDLMSGTRVVVG
jgi:uncharacterized RDD family membrane protein YckC